MRSYILDQTRARLLTQFLSSLSLKTRLPNGFHSIEVEPGFGAHIDPVNGNPYIFIFPETVHEFESAPKSGTDHIRKRYEATIFFQAAVADYRSDVSNVSAPQPTLPKDTEQSASADNSANSSNDESPRFSHGGSQSILGASANKEATDYAERKPFHYEGSLIYPTWLGIEPKWAVQCQENAGSDRIFGDTLHSTEDKARKWVFSKNHRGNNTSHESIVKSDLISKFDNFTASELNLAVTYPDSFGIEPGSSKSCLWTANEKGYLATTIVARDSNAKMADIQIIDAGSRKGLFANFTDASVEGMEQFNEAWIRVSQDVYERKEYRLHSGATNNSPYIVLSKIEFDFYSSLRISEADRESVYASVSDSDTDFSTLAANDSDRGPVRAEGNMQSQGSVQAGARGASSNGSFDDLSARVTKGQSAQFVAANRLRH